MLVLVLVIVTSCLAASTPTATADQVAWQGQGPAAKAHPSSDMAVFIHYNIATAAGTQGCGGCDKTTKGGPGAAPPPIGIWNPSALDTDSWIRTGMEMGATRFIYVAKHGCGFFAYNSSVSYPYNAAHSTAPNADVVTRFVASAKKFGVGFGFYYSVVSNQMCNVCNGVVQPNAGPGQLKVTQLQYDALALAQVTELWTNFGPLEEVWFDGGYGASLKSNLTELLARLQPDVVAFGGQGLSPSPARWVGTEAGHAPYPCWSTDNDPSPNGGGDPDGTEFIPAETDFTLQNNDQWFYNPTAGVHPPMELRNMYETSVGHNTPVIIDFAPMPDGSIPAIQIAAAKTLGKYIRGCYDAPVASVSGGATVLVLGSPSTIDRVLVAEDYAKTPRQLVRKFTLTATLGDGTSVGLVNGTSMGAKFIFVLPSPLTNVVKVTVTVVASVAPAVIRVLSVFSCDALGDILDDEWRRIGYPMKAPPLGRVPLQRYARPWAR